MNRYHRQILLPQIGDAGQEKLARSRVLLVGCGALGSVIADQLARAGVGFLRIVDRDIVELTNLQRQVLFDEADVAEALPKAIAAARKLARINSTVIIEPHVVDVDSQNIEELARDVDVIVDGTDNAATRYLINDASLKHKVPWVYGACVGTEGRMMTIRPGKTACLRCVFPDPPRAGELPTCDTTGVLGPVAGMVASLQSVACIKLLTGNDSAIAQELLTIDTWSNRFRTVGVAKQVGCPTCGARRYEFLDASHREAVQLCGRNAVQIRPSKAGDCPPAAMEVKLRPFGSTTCTPYFMRCALREHAPVELTIFPDGRTIVHGTNDQAKARALYARYVGM